MTDPIHAGPGLQVIIGGGDVVAFIEGLLETAKAGEIDTIAVAMAAPDGRTVTGLAYKPDAEAPYPRTLGAVVELQHNILSHRLTFY